MTNQNAGSTAAIVPAEQQEPRGLPPEMAVIRAGDGGRLITETFAHQWRIAQTAVQSGLMPTIDRRQMRTAEAWLIMQRGAELGFPLLTAVQYLYPVEGRLRLSPDGAKALALKSGLLEDFKEYFEGERTPTESGMKYGDDFRAVCVVKRRGLPSPIVRSFSVAEAKTAGLWPGFQRGDRAKANWAAYPERMLAARARGFAFQDGFADVTGGMQVRDMSDLDPGERIGGVDVETPRLEARTREQPAASATGGPSIFNMIDAEPVEAEPVEGRGESDDGPAPAPAPEPEPEREELSGEELAGLRDALAADVERRAGAEARADLLRELGPINSQADYDAALATLRQHRIFGDTQPIAPGLFDGQGANAPRKRR